MASSEHWYGHMLRGEDGHALRNVVESNVEGEARQKVQKNVEEPEEGEMLVGCMNQANALC